MLEALTKQSIRQKMLYLRNGLSPEEHAQRSAAVVHQLWNALREAEIKTVHTFLPIRSEINILPLVERLLEEQITVIIPKTLPHQTLKHLQLSSLSSLVKGKYGTQFPTPEVEYKGVLDAIIVPGLAFSKEGYRLGYGGGYYDRFLAQHPHALQIGVGFWFQRLPDVPIESHDAKLSQVIVA